MNAETLEEMLLQEAKALCELQRAKTKYAEQTAEIRSKIGDILKSKRDKIGLSRLALSSVIGVNRNTLFVAESPRESGQSFAVERLMDIYRAYDKVEMLEFDKIRIAKNGRGRPRKIAR